MFCILLCLGIRTISDTLFIFHFIYIELSLIPCKLTALYPDGVECMHLT
jgi:hypothetical protein